MDAGRSFVRTVVVKGRFGMGGRLAVLLSAWRYAIDTERELVVDWNDSAYWRPSEPDVFASLLTFPRAKPLNVANLEGARIFPSVWQDRLGRYRNGDVVMPYELSHFPPPYDVKAAEDADVVVITRNGPLETIRPWYPQLRPSEEIARRVEEFAVRADIPNRVGVQIRHGNGERLVRPPETDWFHKRLTHTDRVFLATDSPDLFREFAARFDTVQTEKWWPPSGSGSLHQNESCPDRFQNAVEALVDLFLLARVRRLIFSGGFFGMGARYIAASTGTPERYPKRIHPTFEEKVADRWQNPI